MHYCKYHPLVGATFQCDSCNLCLCDHCVDDEQEQARCFLCAKPLQSLGSSNIAEPFWRRLPEAFRYPLNASSMSLIVITSIASVLAVLMSFLWLLAIPLYLFAMGSLLKYSLACLERTALGEMRAPDVMDAYQGGIRLLLSLIAMTILILLFVGLVTHFLGLALGGMIGFLAVVAYPAILIRFAQTESLFEAMNPVAVFALIAAIGLPYGLLIVFIIIMMTSVGLLQEWIGQLFPAVSYLLQAMVSGYYTLVMFHLMGYMLFQYQEQLGYSVRHQDDESQPTRDVADRLLAKLQVLLKEGEYERLVTGYYQAFKQFPNDGRFYDAFFELLYVCKKSALMSDFGSLYLEFLIRKKRNDLLVASYKKILLIAPDFTPSSAALRVQLGKLLSEQGDNKAAIKLLNGLHKHFPDYAELPRAYSLLAGILAQIPGMQAQSQKCLQLVQQLERIAQSKKTASIKPVTATPSSQAVSPQEVAERPTAMITKSGIRLELVPLDPPVAAETTK